MKSKSIWIMTAVFAVAVCAVFWQKAYNGLMRDVYPVKYSSEVLEDAKENGISPQIVFAVIKNESNFKPGAVSNIGARGLMQLTPDTFSWVLQRKGARDSYTEDDLFNPQINIRYGTILLSQLLSEYGGDKTTALAAYHAGRSNVRKWLQNSAYSPDGKRIENIPFKDTRLYVHKVLKAEAIYDKMYFKGKETVK